MWMLYILGYLIIGFILFSVGIAVFGDPVNVDSDDEIKGFLVGLAFWPIVVAVVCVSNVGPLLAKSANNIAAWLKNASK
jgi:hypothetical protein